MNIFALLTLLNAIIIFSAGNFIFYQNKKNSLNRIFLAICILVAYWSFCQFMYLQAANPQTAYFWTKVSSVSTFLVPLGVHFLLIFTEKSNLLKNKLIFFLLYASALIFTIVDLTTNLITAQPVKEAWGYSYGIPDNTWFLNIFNVWVMVLIALGGFLVLQYFFKNPNIKRKQQAKYILIGLIAPMIAICVDAVFAVLKIKTPELSTLSMSWPIFFIGYAIWKYELFIITPKTAAENIIATMTDCLILSDQQGNIVTVNQAAVNLLGYSQSDLIGRSIEMVLNEKIPKDNLFKKVIKQKKIRDYEINFKDKEEKNIPISLASSVLQDKVGEITGIIFIARDITERKKIEEKAKSNIAELQKMNKFMIGRELKLSELKAKIKSLEKKMGQSEKYE